MKITKTKKRWIIILLLLAVIIIIGRFPPPPQNPIQYYERVSGQLKTEKVAGEKWLVWLYNNPIGEATMWALAKRKLVSSIYGKMMDRTSSAKRIHPFIVDFNIDMSGAQVHKPVALTTFRRKTGHSHIFLYITGLTPI